MVTPVIVQEVDLLEIQSTTTVTVDIAVLVIIPEDVSMVVIGAEVFLFA